MAAEKLLARITTVIALVFTSFKPRALQVKSQSCCAPKHVKVILGERTVATVKRGVIDLEVGAAIGRVGAVHIVFGAIAMGVTAMEVAVDPAGITGAEAIVVVQVEALGVPARTIAVEGGTGGMSIAAVVAAVQVEAEAVAVAVAVAAAAATADGTESPQQTEQGPLTITVPVVVFADLRLVERSVPQKTSCVGTKVQRAVLLHLGALELHGRLRFEPLALCRTDRYASTAGTRAIRTYVAISCSCAAVVLRCMGGQLCFTRFCKLPAVVMMAVVLAWCFSLFVKSECPHPKSDKPFQHNTPCKHFHEFGACRFGSKCFFVHGNGTTGLSSKT